MEYSNNFNFYLPSKDDKSEIYVPGFHQNFSMIDTILSNFIAQSMVDVYAKDTASLEKKRVVKDAIIAVYEGHKDSIPFLRTKNEMSKNGAGKTYLNATLENPHGITPDMLFSREDLKKKDESLTELYDANTLLSPNAQINTRKNSGHNAIIDEINNNVSDGAEVDFPVDRTKQIRGQGKTHNIGSPVIDYSKMYIQDIGNNSTAINNAEYDKSQERIDAKKYRNHKYLYVDSDNQLTQDYRIDNTVTRAGNVDINTRDKHLSVRDANHFESHIKNKGKYTPQLDTQMYPDILENGKIQTNPHNVTASELRDSYSNNATINNGSKAIIRELNKSINKEEKHNGQVGVPNVNKIYWELIDKENNIDGKKQPSISDIKDHKHSSLSDILPAIINDSANDDKNKHVSNKQATKWETHVDTTFSNPHKLKAEQLYTTKNEQNGQKAIFELINKDHLNNAAYTKNNVLWDSVDKENVDGTGKKANLTDIPIRKHDDLQEIKAVNINNDKDFNFKKNKHMSDSQASSVFKTIRVEDDTNILRVSPSKLIGKLKQSSVTDVNVPIEYTYNSNEVKIPCNMPSIQNNLDVYFNITFKQDYSNENIDIYFNNYCLGQIHGITNKYIIPSKFVNGSDNTFSMYWNNGYTTTSETNIVTSISWHQEVRHVGKDAIIDEINTRYTDSDKKINWKEVDKSTSNIKEITVRNHNDLQTIQGYTTNEAPDTKNKHISFNDGKRWDTHINTTDGTNPHKLKLQNIKGINDNRNGVLAVYDEINNHALSNFSNSGFDKVGDNQISWVAISKKEIKMSDIPEAGRTHDSLSKILGAIKGKSSSETLEDKKQDKHLSNVDISKFYDHIEDISDIKNENSKLSNPHRTTAANLYSHLKYDNYKNPDLNGGNAIVDAVNEYADLKKIKWEKIDKNNSSIAEISHRDHSLLTDIKSPDRTMKTKSAIADIHISQNDFVNWETHRLNMDNPHQVKADQIKGKTNKIGAHAIIESINDQKETSIEKIHHTFIDFKEKKIGDNKVLNAFSLRDIPLKNHEELDNILTINGTEQIDTLQGHVTPPQVKTWNTHVEDKNNPHKTTADQIPLGLTDEEKSKHKINGDSIKDVMLEIDSYRNRTYVGVADMAYPGKLSANNPVYYFSSVDSSNPNPDLYIPVTEVYLNSEQEFRGQISSYKTPVSSPDDISEEMTKKFPMGCYKIKYIDMPKNTHFIVYAYLLHGKAAIGYSPVQNISQVTDGQRVNLFSCYISEQDNVTQDYYAIPVGRTALGLAEKLFNRIVQTERIHRQSGMMLAHDERSLKPAGENIETDLSFVITSGTLWDGLQYQYVEKFFSRDNTPLTKNVALVTRTTPAYLDTSIAKHEFSYDYNIKKAINNMYQDHNGGLIHNVPDGKIVVNILYYLPAYNKVYIILSEVLLDDVTQLDELGNRIFPPVLPGIVTSSGILVGLILCQKGKTGVGTDKEFDGDKKPKRIYSPFDIVFTNTTTDVSTSIKHNQLTELYGKPPYYHINEKEYNMVVNLAKDPTENNGETGIESVITKKIVDKRISEIIKDASITRVKNITEIAKKVLKNEDDKVSRFGDTIAGKYILSNNNDDYFILNNSQNKNPKLIFGEYATNSLKNGYYIQYKTNENEMRICNHENYNILQITKNKIMANTDIVTNNITAKYISVTTGLTATENINSINESSKNIGLKLGNENNEGTIVFKHNANNAYSVFRAKGNRFELDTYGNLYINTDLSRPDSRVINESGKLYSKVTGNIKSAVFIGNDGTTETPDYPIILKPYEHSLVKHGISIGNNVNCKNEVLHEKYDLIVAGNMHMCNSNIDNVANIKFNDISITNNKAKTFTFSNQQAESNIEILLNSETTKTIPFTLSITDNVTTIKSYDKKALSINKNGSTGLYYNNTLQLETSNTGVAIKGDLFVEKEIIALNSNEYSDIRMKTVLRNFDDVISKIVKCDPFYYKQNVEFANKIGYSNNNDEIQIGFSAQEMNKIFPEVVRKSPINKIIHDKEVDLLTIDYERLTVILWKAIQEQQKEIEKIKNNL